MTEPPAGGGGGTRRGLSAAIAALLSRRGDAPGVFREPTGVVFPGGPAPPGFVSSQAAHAGITPAAPGALHAGGFPFTHQGGGFSSPGVFQRNGPGVFPVPAARRVLVLDPPGARPRGVFSLRPRRCFPARGDLVFIPSSSWGRRCFFSVPDGAISTSRRGRAVSFSVGGRRAPTTWSSSSPPG